MLLSKGDKKVELRGELLIDEFIEQYPQSKAPLKKWITVVRLVRWRNFPDLKRTFPAADYVAPYVVFNIGGNKFRLVAIVIFSAGIVRVEKVMTHKQYDRWKP
jgi:mRNA interferase HigB